MSSADDQFEAAEVIYQLQLGFIQNYCLVAVSALIFYEHITTLSQEVDLIWARKKTGATMIFMLNRWFTIGMGVAMILLTPNWSTQTVCEVVNVLLPIFQLLLSVVWAVFSALRVFAVGGREWRFAFIIFALGLVPVAANLVGDIRTVYSSLFIPSVGVVCNNAGLLSNTTVIILLVVTRSCLILSDAIVLIITWMKTYGIKKEADNANIKASVVTLLLRDGTIYFAVLLVLNILHLTLSITNVFLDVTYFVTALSSIIISRFLLNLRQINSSDGLSEENHAHPSFVRSLHLSQTEMSDVRFASAVIGNMGAPLSYGPSSAILMDSTAGSESLYMSGSSSDSGAYEDAAVDFDIVETIQATKKPLATGLIHDGEEFEMVRV